MKYYSQSELSRFFGGTFHLEKVDDYLLVTTDSELRAFLLHLKHPNTPIYTGWIEQWKEVTEIIKKGETSVSFSDYLRLKEHTLFPSFQQFLTPFLFTPLLRQAESSALNETLEYVVLLEPDSRSIVENAINTKVQRLFLAVQQLQEQKNVSEEQLMEIIHHVINDQVTKVLNSFSRRSYSFVITYVENCFSILQSKGCTLRMANWIVKQLQLLKLNPEHMQQLSGFQNDLKTGAVHVRNKGRKQSTFPVRTLLTTVGIMAFAGVVLWIIIFEPWSDQVAPQEVETASSFTEFTYQERKHIDSLLKTIQPEPLPQYLENDYTYIEGRELMVDSRKTFANKKADSFYGMWEEYLSKDSVRSAETCKKLTKQINETSLPEGFSLLTDKNNGKPAFFRNESEYTVQLIIFNNQPGNPAFYHELKKNTQVEFNLAIGEYIGVVAGKQVVSYSSAIESIVFCEFDNTTISSLMTFYVLKSSNSYSYKFLISGKDIFDFQVIDMHGVLEVYQ